MAKGDTARSMYEGRRPNRRAKALMRLWVWVGRRRFIRSRLVTLEFRGARTGEPHQTPLVIVRLDGERYLVSMLGEGVAWVRGVRAAGGRAVLYDGGRAEVHLEEIRPDRRAPLLKAFLQVAPGARPHMPVDMDAPVEAFEPVAADYPVFRVTPAPRMRETGPMDTDAAALIPAPADRPETTGSQPDRDFEPFLAGVRSAPADGGVVQLLVRRPDREQRLLADEVELTRVSGVVGDDWSRRPSRTTPDGSPDPEAQVTIMSTRVLAAIAPDRGRWPLAGDQVYVDADLSDANLPAGTRVALGTAILVISEKPHTGCAKFSARFGSDALRWINSPTGRELRMRGVNARIEQGGVVRVGDTLRKL